MIPDQIFRQGYEFLESIDTDPFFRVGLNFVSFQGGTDKIYRIIKYGFEKSNFGGLQNTGADKLLQVRGAGLFLVPPFKRGQNFPGELIFTQRTTDSSSAHKTISYM
jgi:deferrochelatase/peroxidase EfeB